MSKNMSQQNQKEALYKQYHATKPICDQITEWAFNEIDKKDQFIAHLQKEMADLQKKNEEIQPLLKKK